MKLLLFGASGTVGGAVLRACVNMPIVTEVRVIVRRPLGRSNEKLREFVHTNYSDYAGVTEAFRGVDACLFCLGVSATQVSKEEYVKISHDYPIAAAKVLKKESPLAAFHYISGAGTRADSRAFWARVKGQTENELMVLIEADCWRPAYIDAEPSPTFPKVFAALRPVLRLLKPFPSLYVSGEDLGRAMVEAMKQNLRRRVIENAGIRTLVKQGEGT
jgi:uncharacterized protein YbjT (DUF2867 family)